MTEYIDQETAIAWFMPYAHAGESIDADVVISDIKGMKTADVVPVKHGRWILVDTGKGIGVCSNCNRQDIIDHLATHCRFCGAMMEGETTLKNEMEAKEE